MRKDKKQKEELKKECHCNEGEPCICEDECNCGEECTCEDTCNCSDDCSCGCTCECDDGCSCGENELVSQIKELQNKLLYKDAEMINYRRRKEEETASMLKYANQDLVLDVIKSVDNFERAIDSIKKDDEKDNTKILTGIEMIYNELKETLKKYGVKEISEVDVPFDASIHHAVMTDEISEKEDDIVLEVMMKGYILKDRVIRPAMVKVNKIN